ncbi:MAG: tetratricopeptide repeat protein [Caldilineaceae bacterium]
MRTNRTLLVFLAVFSAVLMLLLSFLVNLASTFVADALKPHAFWIFAALGVVFLASLGAAVWQVRTDRQSEQLDPLQPKTIVGDSISAEVGAGAQRVAVGKNIVQIGTLSLPRWAALLIVAILALVAVLAGSVAYSSQRTAAVLSSTPSPTALPFAPAADGETLIVIATFSGKSAEETQLDNEIRAAIQEQIEGLSIGSTRVEIDPGTIINEKKPNKDQQDEARALGSRYNASMVIWGQATLARVTVNFLNLREPKLAAADVNIQETHRTALAATPEAYALFVTDELPKQMSFFALFAIGQAHYLNAQYALAAERIEAAVALIEPHAKLQGLADAYYRLGWLYQQPPARLNQAVENYSKAIDLESDYADAFNNRGNAYAAQGERDEAIADYSKAIELDQNNAAAYYNRGNAYAAKGKQEEAIADYGKVIELDPQYALIYIDRGIAYAAQNKLEEAIADYSKAVALEPQYAYAYFSRGFAYAMQNKLDEAIADYGKAIELDPQYADAYISRGNAYAAQGRQDEAIAGYDKAIELDPQYADAYISRGIVYAAQNKLDEAIADYGKAIELDPQYALVYIDRGIVFAAQGKLDEAIADYGMAIELNPQYAYAYISRGNAYAAQGRQDEAIADYDKAIELDPQYADAYISRGIVYAAQGRQDEAIADYGKAIELDPQYALAYIDRGIVFAAQGKLDEAIADYGKAIELNPQYAYAYFSRGFAYAAQGKQDEAIADYGKAIELDPAFAVAYFNRARAYRTQNRLDKAIADYTKATQHYRDNIDKAAAYNELCLTYLLQQQPQIALPNCQRAVTGHPQPVYFDRRGLAYALSGDFKMALADFQTYESWLEKQTDAQSAAYLAERKAWIAALKGGKNPITFEVLEVLRKQ